MRDRCRPCVLSTLLLAVSLSTTSAGQTAPPGSHWQIGDVFVGVGITIDDRQFNPGEYLVYSADGVLKETLIDPQAAIDRAGSTTGCVAGRPLPDGGFADDLYATTFDARRVIRFEGSHAGETPAGLAHLPRQIHAFTDADVYSIESLAFDSAGNYFVAAHPPETGATRAVSRIFKFKPDHALERVYEVPYGESGVDWIDIGSDNRTIYYTSEGNQIFVFRPDATTAEERIRTITIREATGEAVGGSAFAIRVLPPRPGTFDPSGFLVAMNSGAVRLDASGVIVKRYAAPVAGTYFALNVTPDGQSFWMATLGQYSRPRLNPSGGRLMKVHIPTGELLVGPLDTGKLNAAGLCIKREYTAAVNQCVETDANGHALLDANGRPVQQACRIPEVCETATIDEDGDGLESAGLKDPDCDPRGAPRLEAVDQVSAEGERVTSVRIVASDANGGALDPSVSPILLDPSTPLPQGLSMTSGGLITGVLGWQSSGSHDISVSVAVNGRQTRTRFRWDVRDVNGPPDLTGPETVTCLVGLPCPAMLIGVFEPDMDSLINVSATGLPSGMAVPSTVAGGANRYGFAVTGALVQHTAGDYRPRICAEDNTIASKAGRAAGDCVEFTLRVRGNQAPVCTAAAATQMLWPPNHKMVEVGVSGVTDPDPGDSVRLTVTGILQDEAPDITGAGRTAGSLGYVDGYIAPSRATAWIRAERTGVRPVPGEGRVYEILFTASDGMSSCSGRVFTGIPHEFGTTGDRLPLDSGLRWDSITGVRVR